MRGHEPGETMIELRNLSKTFATPGGELHAVSDVDLTIEDGEIFGIIGFSGAGKSTLVRCINLLERPTQGSVIVNGCDLVALPAKGLREARKKIGMIFQQFNLLQQRTVAANVRYPLDIAGVPRAKADARVAELLELVGLSEKASSYPAQLSGGQQQRVAIARALASDPDIILCDEATSALDPEATRSVLDLLKELNGRLGVTIVVITHEMKVVELVCDRVAVMAQGRICEVGAVRDVFLHPTSETARRLIAPAMGALESSLDGELPPGMVRIAFTGEESGDPVISDLSLSCGVRVSIMGANTQDIGGHAFGQMLIQLPADPEAANRVRAYLDGRGIHYEEAGDPRMPSGDGTEALSAKGGERQ